MRLAAEFSADGGLGKAENRQLPPMLRRPLGRAGPGRVEDCALFGTVGGPSNDVAPLEPAIPELMPGDADELKSSWMAKESGEIAEAGRQAVTVAGELMPAPHARRAVPIEQGEALLPAGLG